MVYKKRRYSRRKKTYRRKKYGVGKRKAGNKFMVSKGPGGGQRIFRYKRWFDVADFIVPASSAVPTFAAYSFSLQNLQGAAVPNTAGYTDFTNLYDQYKIVGIKFMLIPPTNMANVAGSQRFQIYSVIDRDDSAFLTGIEQAMQYSTFKMTVNTKTHTTYFKPSTSEKITDINGTTFIKVTGPSWNDRDWETSQK